MDRQVHNKFHISRCGGIGRHKGLKIPRSKIRTGSIPVSGTKNRAPHWGALFLVNNGIEPI